MLYIKCTNEVLKQLGLKKEQLAEPVLFESALGNWYVHRFSIGRQSAYIFMSETTLLSFVLLKGKRPVTPQTLPSFLVGGLSQLLKMRGLDETTIEQVMESFEVGLFSKTDSRSDLGSLNDLIKCYRHRIEFDGGLNNCDLTHIIMSTNEMPQRRLNWENSWGVAIQRIREVPLSSKAAAHERQA